MPGARALNAEAADLMESDPESAEALLREAITLDLYCGPAHNNLGVLHLNAGRLYQAAEEFEWARKLMPGHPDPRLNLAITLDRAGRSESAWEAYEAVLAAQPGHIGAMQGLARLCVRKKIKDPRLLKWLEEIRWRGDHPMWRSWSSSHHK